MARWWTSGFDSWREFLRWFTSYVQYSCCLQWSQCRIDFSIRYRSLINRFSRLERFEFIHHHDTVRVLLMWRYRTKANNCVAIVRDVLLISVRNFPSDRISFEPFFPSFSYARTNDRLFVTTFIENDSKTRRWSRSIVKSKKKRNDFCFFFWKENIFDAKETILKRTADLLEQCYTMSGNPHHFALPTPPSDHENESSALFRIVFNVLIVNDHLPLLSAYYMSSLEGIIREEWREGIMLICLSCDLISTIFFCMSVLS